MDSSIVENIPISNGISFTLLKISLLKSDKKYRKLFVLDKSPISHVCPRGPLVMFLRCGQMGCEAPAHHPLWSMKGPHRQFRTLDIANLHSSWRSSFFIFARPWDVKNMLIRTPKPCGVVLPKFQLDRSHGEPIQVRFSPTHDGNVLVPV